MEEKLLAKSKDIDKTASPILSDEGTFNSGSNISDEESSSGTFFDADALRRAELDDSDDQAFNPELEKNFPVKNWDRFEFRKFLGMGGMGIVYQAWDTNLNRLVALKFLRNSYGQASKRFLQEARAQCRIEHPNICKVYEAGEVNNIPYIAMQYIEGTTLRFAYKEMSLEQKVQVIRDIALAIQSAHRLGIIHRDIKPDNVMLAKNDEGAYHPIVMDFGLAKEIGNKGLTQTGALIGTPAYMSPEQAKGQVQLLDRRTDVYSLGAMFYSILVGKAPFQGSSAMEVVLKVISNDVESISHLIPSIPKDINTIVMKCLEKDPKERYESAQSLAQDLDRYLNGEPISIRATSWYIFVWRKALKHKAIVIVSTVALLAIIILSSLSVWTWLESSRRAELERQMAEQAERIESTMRFVSLTSPHDIRAERQMAQQELELIKKQMKESGRLAEGPGNYALGRSYLAFFDYEKARTHLELAYKSGFRTPNLDLAMSQVLGEFYRREIDSLPQSDDKEATETRLNKLDKEYLEPIKEHLTAYLNAKSKRSTQEVAYLEGLLALYKKDYSSALSKADETIGKSSWFYEGYLLKGEIYLSWAQENAIKGNYNESKELLVMADSCFQNASKIGPSNLQAKLGQARKWGALFNLNLNLSEPSEEAFKQTLLATDKVLELDSDNVQACLFNMRVYNRLGDNEGRDRKDPNPTLQKAIYWGEKVLLLNPKESDVYRTLGSIYRILGKYALERGDNPHQLFDLAISNLEKNLEFKPRSDAYSTMGLIYQSKAQYEEKIGKDPQTFYEEGVKRFKKAIELNPKSSKTLSNLGRIYNAQGEYEQRQGKNPRTFYEKASDSFQKAIELNPKDPYAYTNLSLLCQAQAEYEIEKGQDPQVFFKQATATLEKAIEINPNYVFAYNSLGILYQIKADYELEQGKDLKPSIEQAIINFKKVFQIRPEYGAAYYTLGLVYQTRLKYEIASGQDINDSFEQAKTNFEKAIEINPQSADAYKSLGFLFYSKLENEINLGRENESKKLFDSAMSNYKKAMEINPKQTETILYNSLLFSSRAEWQLNKGQIPNQDLMDAFSQVEKVIDKKTNELAQIVLAKIERLNAKLAIAQKRSPEGFFANAKESLKKALEFKSNNIKTYNEFAKLALLEAEWKIYNEQNPEEALTQSLEMAEKSLALNRVNIEANSLKGKILLLKNKSK